MQSDIDDARYKSTVRSCAEQCEPRDDYQNCTRDLYITRGCVRRMCCHNNDLCNSAARLTSISLAVILVFVGSTVWVGTADLRNILEIQEVPVAALERTSCSSREQWLKSISKSMELDQPRTEVERFYLQTGTIDKLSQSSNARRSTDFSMKEWRSSTLLSRPAFRHQMLYFESFKQQASGGKRHCSSQCRNYAFQNMIVSLRSLELAGFYVPDDSFTTTSAAV